MDTKGQVMADEATTPGRTDSFHSGNESQKISYEELHQNKEEDVHETLRIGPFSVWALGNHYSAPDNSLMNSQSVGFADTFY